MNEYNKRSSLLRIFRALYSRFGPQGWWPGDSRFEIIIGAILTQNTNWTNVENAINNLKLKGLINVKRLESVDIHLLAYLIKPCGYYNLKARRLKDFLDFLDVEYGGSIERMAGEDTVVLREKLLNIRGVGPETADSILLYGLERPEFVVDSYTFRVFSRHGLVPEETDYDVVKGLFMDHLRPNVRLFNEYHALIVRLGKTYCRKKDPLCSECPFPDLNFVI